MSGPGTTTTYLPKQMTVITLQDFTEKFSTQYPELASFYELDVEENRDMFDGSDTYIDMDDYEFNQLY